MFALRFALSALPLLGAAASTLPRPDGPMCPTGSVQCCQTYEQASNIDPQTADRLKSIHVDLGSLTGLVGLTCTAPIDGACSSNALCCTNNYFNGAINVGCTQIVL